MSKIVNVDITMYGIAEVLMWCLDRNKGRVPGVDTPGFKKNAGIVGTKASIGGLFYT